MTSDDRSQQERRLDDERCVDALLAEGGFPDNAELRAVLLQLRELRVTEVPEPSPELAAILGRPASADVVSLDDWSRRRSRKKRIVFTTLAVAASLGVAGGAAAGNETLGSQAEGAISGIIRSFSPPVPAPPEPTTTAPAPPAQAPAPAQAAVPSPAVPTAVTGSAAPAPKAAPTAGERQQTSPAPNRGKQEPRDAGATSALPRNDGESAAPGASRAYDGPPQVNRPPMVGTPGNGNAKGAADNDAGTWQGGAVQNEAGQDAGRPNNGPNQGNRR